MEGLEARGEGRFGEVFGGLGAGAVGGWGVVEEEQGEGEEGKGQVSFGDFHYLAEADVLSLLGC